ncbi:hypothetical protein CR513_01038, partial [Mucuna pruriens]
FAKHIIVASSIIVVEFMACFEASNRRLLLWNFVICMCVCVCVFVCKFAKHIIVASSIIVVEFVACFEASYHRLLSTFIEIKYLVVKERVQEKRIYIKNIGTYYILLYPLIKDLTPK